MSRLSYCYFLMEQNKYVFLNIQNTLVIFAVNINTTIVFFKNPEDTIGYAKLKQPKTNRRNIMTLKKEKEKRKEKLTCLARWPGLPLLTDVGPAVRSWF